MWGGQQAVKQTAFQRLRRRLVYSIPRSRLLYRSCSRYVNSYNGEFDYDIRTNGELHTLKKHLPTGPETVVLDVGANVGDWCEAVLSIAPHAQTHCFEPCSTTFQQLVSKGLPPSVVCNNLGLSSCPSMQQLAVFRSSRRNSLYSGSRFGEEPKAYEKVRMETLTGYCRNRGIATIDYLKIDVEGHELDVLQGATEMLSEHRIRIIQFEYTISYVFAGIFLRDILEFISNFDYDVYKILPRRLLAIQEYHKSLETFHYSNYLLKLKDIQP